jgi:NADH-quinone oxidoreductase subunit L
VTINLFSWLSVGSLHVNAALLIDPLSITMCLFVTGISTLIHLYSIGYMHGERDFTKFFLYLNAFVFSMLVLVTANNLVLTFVGWEGVGVCSYWLVSYYFEDRGQRRQEGLPVQPRSATSGCCWRCSCCSTTSARSTT